MPATSRLRLALHNFPSPGRHLPGRCQAPGFDSPVVYGYGLRSLSPTTAGGKTYEIQGDRPLVRRRGPRVKQLLLVVGLVTLAASAATGASVGDSAKSAKSSISSRRTMWDRGSSASVAAALPPGLNHSRLLRRDSRQDFGRRRNEYSSCSQPRLSSRRRAYAVRPAWGRSADLRGRSLKDPGLYVFVCKVHPFMLAAVVVDDQRLWPRLGENISCSTESLFPRAATAPHDSRAFFVITNRRTTRTTIRSRILG